MFNFHFLISSTGCAQQAASSGISVWNCTLKANSCAKNQKGWIILTSKCKHVYCCSKRRCDEMLPVIERQRQDAVIEHLRNLFSEVSEQCPQPQLKDTDTFKADSSCKSWAFNLSKNMQHFHRTQNWMTWPWCKRYIDWWSLKQTWNKSLSPVINCY